MHLRGTHCVRSVGKNQISRAQSRVKSGTAFAKDGVTVGEAACESADSGRVHTANVERTAMKLFWEASGVVAAGSGCGADVDSVKQQHSAILPAQHEDFFCAPKSGVV